MASEKLLTIISVYSSPTNVNGMSRITGSVALSSPRGPNWSPSAAPNGNKPYGTVVEKFEGESPEV